MDHRNCTGNEDDLNSPWTSAKNEFPSKKQQENYLNLSRERLREVTLSLRLYVDSDVSLSYGSEW